VAAPPDFSSTLARDGRKAASFYALFEIGGAQFRFGVPTFAPDALNGLTEVESNGLAGAAEVRSTWGDNPLIERRGEFYPDG
jgi:hypothetical protein